MRFKHHGLSPSDASRTHRHFLEKTQETGLVMCGTKSTLLIHPNSSNLLHSVKTTSERDKADLLFCLKFFGGAVLSKTTGCFRKNLTIAF